jgi:hypothetical protein
VELLTSFTTCAHFYFFFVKVRKFPKIYLYILFFILILVVCSFVSLFNGYKPEGILRDFGYFSKPFLSFLIGIQLSKLNDSQKILANSLLIATLIYLVTYFFQIIMLPFDINELSIQKWRVLHGAGELIVPMLVIMIHAGVLFNKLRFKKILLVLLYIQIFLTFSRVSLLFLIFFHFLNSFSSSGITGMYHKLRFIIFLAFSTVIVYLLSGFGEFNFFDKVTNSIREVSVLETSDVSTASAYWRGFELFLVLNDLKSYSLLEFLVGKGFGYELVLPFEIKLAGNDYTSLWYVHNGYLYLFMKLGCIGLFLLGLFFWKFFYTSIRNGNNLNLIKSLVLFVIASTVVMAGPFESNDFAGILIIMGYIFSKPLHSRNNEKRYN